MQVEMEVNGKKIQEEVLPQETLIDFLRNRLGLSSVKKGCDVGECGTCTVLFNGDPLRSCLVLAVQADGAAITTIEGLASNGELHYIQQAFLEKYGFQCGFCTPGMILSTKALLDSNPDPSIEEIKEALEGNLCRCTGYEQIIESVLRAIELKNQSA
jgi:carbon-monoxide dehydrogenase small subunit